MKFQRGIRKPERVVSPFVRREWIEIPVSGKKDDLILSPFVRREWIEIPIVPLPARRSPVSLREKGVD